LSLEFPHVSPVMWQKRQSIKKFKKQKPMFKQLMDMTAKCMREHPELANDVHGAIQCEVIHPETMSKFTDFTFHTHPHGDIDYPSDKDIETTKTLNKEWLLIGLPTRNKVVVYNAKDGFKRKVAEF